MTTLYNNFSMTTSQILISDGNSCHKNKRYSDNQVSIL